MNTWFQSYSQASCPRVIIDVFNLLCSLRSLCSFVLFVNSLLLSFNSYWKTCVKVKQVCQNVAEMSKWCQVKNVKITQVSQSNAGIFCQKYAGLINFGQMLSRHYQQLHLLWKLSVASMYWSKAKIWWWQILSTHCTRPCSAKLNTLFAIHICSLAFE